MRRCTSCNAELAEGALFCPHCGVRVTAAQPPADGGGNGNGNAGGAGGGDGGGSGDGGGARGGSSGDGGGGTGGRTAAGSDDSLQRLHEVVRGIRTSVERLPNEQAVQRMIGDRLNPMLQDFARLREEIQRSALAAQRPPITDGRRTGSRLTDEQREQQSEAFRTFLLHGRDGLARLPAEQRDLVEDATGQILVPEQLDTEVIRTVPTLVVIRNLAGVRQTTSNRVRRLSMTEVQVGWAKLETGAGSSTNSGYTPSEAYMYVEDQQGLAKVGIDELEDSAVDIEAFLADSFARALGESEETAFVVGTGHASNQPEGLTDGTTITRVVAMTGDTTTLSHESMLKLMYGPATQYRRNGVFVVHSQIELALMQLRSDTSASTKGQFLWQPAVAEGKPNTYWGKPIYTQDDLESTLAADADNVAIFGDFRVGYRIVDRRGMRVQRLAELFSGDGLIGVQVTRRVAGAVVVPAALRILQMAAT